jgi:hypothetical protein
MNTRISEKVLELVNLSRTARGMIRVNQHAELYGAIDLETATLADLLLPENISDEYVSYSTKKDAKAVAIAWTQALPEEFGTRYSNNLQGYCVRLPQALRDFMNS